MWKYSKYFELESILEYGVCNKTESVHLMCCRHGDNTVNPTHLYNKEIN